MQKIQLLAFCDVLQFIKHRDSEKKDYLGWQHETAVAVAAAHTEVLMNLTFFVLECVRVAEK